MRIHNITLETIDTLILRLACVFTSVVLLLLFLPLLIGFDTCFAQESQSRMFSSPGQASDALFRAAQKENEPAWKLSSDQGKKSLPQATKSRTSSNASSSAKNIRDAPV
jgi:hypothetical protein